MSSAIRCDPVEGSVDEWIGKFTVTKDVSHLTKASFLKSVGTTTPIYTRLSTVTYGVSSGSPDMLLTRSASILTPRGTRVGSPLNFTPMQALFQRFVIRLTTRHRKATTTWLA